MKSFDVCIHHTDPDGWASAAIVGAPLNIGLGYKTMINNSVLLNQCHGKRVIMVDFSLPLDTMKFIQSIASEFVWIDHHESSADLKTLGLTGIHDTAWAGCILTWRYFHPHAELPDAIRFIGDRDTGDQTKIWLPGEIRTWTFLYPETSAYCHGLSNFPGIGDPANPFWQELLESNRYTLPLIERGQIILDQLENDFLWHSRMRVYLVPEGNFLLTNATANVSDLSDYLIRKFQVPRILTWDINNKGLGLHGRGENALDLFKGLLRGHPNACGGSLELPQGWDFINSLYQRAHRI